MNKKHFRIECLFLALTVAFSLSAQERLIILNEGSWQANNGRISYFEDGQVISNKWFEEKNGYGIGDTPNDIIQVGEDLIAIAVNTSNIVQFIRTDGSAVKATENVPNNRRLATDGEYLYVTSYAHECGTPSGTWTCEKGYVAKISLSTFEVVDCCEVGWEPEGIAYYEGSLFVANTGGYAFQEGHDYESTVSVVDASTMKKIKDIDTGAVNLYGQMSQSGQYLCINSSGDYYEKPACTVIMDCEKALKDDECLIVIDQPATYSTTTTDGRFLTVGSSFSYVTYAYDTSLMTIDPEVLLTSGGAEGISLSLPGTVADDISSKISSIYGIYVNPYSGYIYATDANGYGSSGYLHQWTPDGKYIDKFKLYICPGHFLALGNWKPTSVSLPSAIRSDRGHILNLAGQKLAAPQKGINIINGKKILVR